MNSGEFSTSAMVVEGVSILCESFPNLFDMIDESKTGEVERVSSKDFGKVVDACTMCDMCFLTKCPYVPPHEFNLDFPHLMLEL